MEDELVAEQRPHAEERSADDEQPAVEGRPTEEEQPAVEEPMFRFTLPVNIIKMVANLKAQQHRNLCVEISHNEKTESARLNVTKHNYKFVTFSLPSRCLNYDERDVECYVHQAEKQLRGGRPRKESTRATESEEKKKAEARKKENEKMISEIIDNTEKAKEMEGEKTVAENTQAVNTDEAKEPNETAGRRYSTRKGRTRIVQLLKAGKHPTDSDMVSLEQMESIHGDDGGDNTDGEDGDNDGEQESNDDEEKSALRKRKRKKKTLNVSVPKRKRPSYKREANVPCKLCGLKYKDHLVLAGHVKAMHANHPEKKSYMAELRPKMVVKCDLCNHESKNKMLLADHKVRKHRETVANDASEDFQCKQCEQTFAHSCLLRDHMISVHREKKHQTFLCHLCSGKFTSAAAMDHHVKYVHDRKVLFQCDLCSKTFHSPRYLKRHMMVHSNTITKCSQCNYTTRHTYNLKRHMADMHEEADKKKSYACSICDKEFRNMQNMEVHLNYVHYKVTPYYCSLCKKYLLRKSELMDHAEKNHPGMVVLASEDIKIQKSDDGKYKEPKMQIVDRNLIFVTSGDGSETTTIQLAEDISTPEVTVQIESAPKDDQTVDEPSQELIEVTSAAAVLESFVAEVVNVHTQQ